MEFLNKIYKSIFQNSDLKKELQCFFDWIGQHINYNEYVLLKTNKDRVVYKLFFELPWKIGKLPKKIKLKRCLLDEKNEISCAFILIEKKNNLVFDIERNWQQVGDGFFFNLYENKNRFKENQLPLRFGLLETEKKQALKLARSALDFFLQKKEIPSREIFKDLSVRFRQKTDLNVAIWTNGRLRGSFVLENKELGEGIVEATITASRDFRFKPLKYEELLDTRIEITLMSDLRVFLPKFLIKKNDLIPDKGFKLTFKNKIGWFLPEVFNVKRFKNLEEFLDSLAKEKAGLELKDWQKTEAIIETFTVNDFIDDKEKIGIVNLFGPVIFSGFNEKKIKERLYLAADWLINIQESDGNFLPIIDPLYGYQRQIDWPRSCFCGWVLAEFGIFTKEDKYIKASIKNFQYTQEYFDKGINLGINNLLLTLAYTGQQAISLFKITRDNNYYFLAKDYSERILNKSHELIFEPIVFLQIASFFAELFVYYNDKRLFEYAKKKVKTVEQNFENNLKKKKTMQLAAWAEIINTFLKIYTFEKNIDYVKFCQRVVRWLLQYQLNQAFDKTFGPFAASTDSDFVYTRGTAKILEILPLVEKMAKELELSSKMCYNSFEKAIRWLLSMQYNEDNIYFVPKEKKEIIIGGFRHDYFNQEAWIDAAGHFLLAGIRFLNR